MNPKMIVPRVSRDETTFALVEFAGVARQQVKAAVQRAVTDWIKNSDEGRRAYANWGQSFNLRDLSIELPNPPRWLTKQTTLERALLKQGLTYLSVETYYDD